MATIEQFEFYLVNGYACSKTFKCSLQEAIKACESDSRFMNTRNWLYQKIDGKFKEIGHTTLDGYFWRYMETSNGGRESH